MAHDKNSFAAANRLDDEGRMLISHIADMLKICEKSHSPRFSAFLSEGEAVLARSFLEYMGTDLFRLYGGYEGAARNILCIYPEYCEPDDCDYPLRAVRFESRAASSLTHRDYLGSIMALGINRAQTGDIVCDEKGAYALLSPAAADMAVTEIEKIGRAGVKTSYAAEGGKIVRQDKFSEISGTVASLRLDCILGTALRVSREKAALLVRSGAVSLDHVVCESVSANVSQGSVMSVRGHGRFILSEVGDRTKKDRIHITVLKYL